MAGGAMSNCEAKATEKKLAGAAKTSFVKKCETDAGASATAACDAKATEKKLAGAAKTSFVKKCETDAPARWRRATPRRPRRSWPARPRRASPRSAWLTPRPRPARR